MRQAPTSAELRPGGLDGLLGFHLRMASAAVARDFIAAMDGLGLTQKQFAVLELVAANRGVAQIDVAGALGMDRATTMTLVRRLEARGLLQRAPSPHDGRRQELGLSAAGRTLMREARRRVRVHERRIAARLADAGALIEVLRALHERA